MYREQTVKGAGFYYENCGFYVSAVIPLVPHIHLSARCGLAVHVRPRYQESIVPLETDGKRG
jgi:hypothetical protein